MMVNKEKAEERFREHVLNALDKAAKEVFGCKLGATDADLPDIFSMVELQVRKVAHRNKIHLHEPHQRKF